MTPLHAVCQCDAMEDLGVEHQSLMPAGTSADPQIDAPPSADAAHMCPSSIQAEFLSRDEQPAARATRVTRRRDAAAANDHAETGGTAHAPEEAAAAVTSGDVPEVPATDTAGAAAIQ
jgi:hypothetical protein